MVMKKETTAPKLVEPTPGTTETVETTEAVTPITIPAETMEELDEEEKECRTLRRDLPGVKGSSAAGIVTISVGKTPPKNEFFRTHPEFRPIVSIVNVEVGMEKFSPAPPPASSAAVRRHVAGPFPNPPPAGRFGEPQFPDLKPAKIFRLAFRDKGTSGDNLVLSVDSFVDTWLSPGRARGHCPRSQRCARDRPSCNFDARAMLHVA